MKYFIINVMIRCNGNIRNSFRRIVHSILSLLSISLLQYRADSHVMITYKANLAAI